MEEGREPRRWPGRYSATIACWAARWSFSSSCNRARFAVALASRLRMAAYQSSSPTVRFSLNAFTPPTRQGRGVVTIPLSRRAKGSESQGRAVLSRRACWRTRSSARISGEWSAAISISPIAVGSASRQARGRDRAAPLPRRESDRTGRGWSTAAAGRGFAARSPRKIRQFRRSRPIAVAGPGCSHSRRRGVPRPMPPN